MITLEQVILLDEKIQKAVDTITSLRSENADLKGKLSEYQTRIEELEVLIKEFKNDQGEIEEGILKALKQLEVVDVDQPAPAKTPAPAQKDTEKPESKEVTPSPEPEAVEPPQEETEPPQTEGESVAYEADQDDDAAELDIF